MWYRNLNHNQNGKAKMTKYFPHHNLKIESKGSFDVGGSATYATVITDVRTGVPILVMYFDDEKISDQLAQNLALAWQKALCLELVC